ncbi:hypothetical protein LOK49_LG03G01266 [Camellia lanceoleosa]|uniref:Uncharacterized protein n=1 Tax=Camellia lanceoleosa TaxID=1840588 RepID=A0ACC0IC13_9ERIC|nr:hypothetical protein LOK49_LG03G01266 [Camellia lanceoleosa]
MKSGQGNVGLVMVSPYIRLCLKSSIFGRVYGILHHLGEVSATEKNSIVKFVLAPYAGAFLLNDEPWTDPSVVSGSDTDKNIYVLKGKELFNRLNEVGTLAQITRIQGDQVVLIGHRRLRITEVVSEDPLTVKVDHLKDKPYNKDDDVIKATSFEVISTLRDVLKMSSLWRDHVQTYTQRFASSAALLVGDPTAMHDHEMFVLEDTTGSTVA